MHAGRDGRIEKDVDAACREDEGAIDPREHLRAEGRGVGEVARDDVDRRGQVRVLWFAGQGADCDTTGQEGGDEVAADGARIRYFYDGDINEATELITRTGLFMLTLVGMGPRAL